jgi:hypothetical protein
MPNSGMPQVWMIESESNNTVNKMRILRPKEKSFRFKKIAVIALFLTVFDAFVTGLPFWGLMIAFFLGAAAGISAIIFLFRDRRFLKLYAVKSVIYLAALVSIIGIFKFNAFIGSRNAESLIQGVNSYFADFERYPEDLKQLIPNYLDNIPKCAYRLMDNEFRYRTAQDNVYLMWTIMPPWSRKQYDFKTQTSLLPCRLRRII